MKSLIFTAATLAAFAMPLTAFPQTDQPVTRAQVQAELRQLEQAGYRQTGEDPSYPVNIQAAEARVSTQSSATGYGGTPPASSMSGSRSAVQPASPEEMKQIYMGGQ
jgi:hypothetical protein